jgi:sulfur carrier protein
MPENRITMQIIVNGSPREVAESTTIADLLKELQLSDKPVAVELNLQIAPKPSHAEHHLSPGDRLEIVTLVGGG